MPKGMLIIISGPSGSGKGTVVKSLASENRDFALSISYTTRTKRVGEQEGVDYFFITPQEFAKFRDNDQLLEHVSILGNLYATPRFYVEEQIELGKTVLMEIDVNGALQVKARFPECVLIFLIPPTFQELEKRLINRGTEDMETIENRVRRARDEIKLISRYDYLVINDRVQGAVECINHIAHAESLRPYRREEIISKYGNEG